MYRAHIHILPPNVLKQEQNTFQTGLDLRRLLVFRKGAVLKEEELLIPTEALPQSRSKQIDTKGPFLSRYFVYCVVLCSHRYFL